MKKYITLFKDPRSCRDKIFEGDKFIYSKKYLVKCIRKISFFPKKCPFCKSKNTYHTIANIKTNVFDFEDDLDYPIRMSKKWDFCFKCHRKFLLEMYVLEYSRRKSRRKKS